MDARFKCPFNMQVSGPSQSGKTHWVNQLLKYQDDLLEYPITRVRWHTPHQHEVPSLPFIEIVNALPWEEEEDKEDDEADHGHKLIVLDDFGLETRNSTQLTNYFTRYSHHSNTSIIQIIQNLFWSGNEGRTRSLNTHYIVLMRQSRDQKQIRTLGRQITQTNGQLAAFMDAYNVAIGTRPYSYLLISLHPRDNNDLMLRSNIYPDEAKNASVYLLRKKI